MRSWIFGESRPGLVPQLYVPASSAHRGLMTREPSGCSLCLGEWGWGFSSGLLRTMSLPPLGPSAPTRGDHSLTLPSTPGEISGAAIGGGLLHTPVRGDGLPVFLPPGVQVHGGVFRAEEPHDLSQGHLHQRGLRACQVNPGKVRGEGQPDWHTCHDQGQPLHQCVPSCHRHSWGQRVSWEAKLQKPVDLGIPPPNPPPCPRQCHLNLLCTKPGVGGQHTQSTWMPTMLLFCF